jgi:hypothetical protein
MLVLDSGGFGKLAERSRKAMALIEEFRQAGLWPPVVPTIVLAEPGGTVLTGDEADITALAAVSKNVVVELV